MRSILILTAAASVSCALGSAIAAAPPSCEHWNTKTFFAQADATAVGRCLREGASSTVPEASSAHPPVPTQLHRAASRSKDPEVVRLLIEAGADHEARDDFGRTPLHWAVESSDSAAVVVALLDAGSDLEARDDFGETPLHWAAESNKFLAVAPALCLHNTEPGLLEWRTFTEEKAEDRPRLFFSELTGETYFVRSEFGRCLGWIKAPILHFLNTCRHPVSGREHTVIYTQLGASFGHVEIWSIDPVTRDPVQDYVERSGDRVIEGVGMDELIAADGDCLWQNRQKGRKIFGDAMSDLLVGREVELDRLSELPTRILSTETVYKWLNALSGIARLEGAVYAGSTDRRAWRLVQVLGVWSGDMEGVVLLLDRKTGVWRAIYDVQTHFKEFWNYPLRGMVIEDNKLFISACIWCFSHPGEYDNFAVDLRTYRVVPLKEESKPTGPREDENAPISDIELEIFSD